MRPYKRRYSCAIKAALLRPYGPRNDEGGFILPLAMILIIVLTVSGMSFLHLDFLERRMALSTADYHAAFYLASAGIERAREAFLYTVDPNTGNATWTSLLQGTNPQTDPNPDPALCPDGLARGCVIPPFGGQVTSPGMPFGQGFDDGFYSVRLMNNLDAGSPDTVDDDGVVILRALGSVRGQRKVLEVSILPVPNLNLMNCQGAVGADCPEMIRGTPVIDFQPGKDPTSLPQIPTPIMGLYDDPKWFPFIQSVVNIDGAVNGCTLSLQNDTYYSIINCNSVNLQGVSAQNVVLNNRSGPLNQQSRQIVLQGQVTLTQSILIGGSLLFQNSNNTISAHGHYPALIGEFVSGNRQGQGTVNGAIFAGAAIRARAVTVHGISIAGDVHALGGSVYTDKDAQGNPLPYQFLAGFNYPSDYLGTAIQGWEEVQ